MSDVPSAAAHTGVHIQLRQPAHPCQVVADRSAAHGTSPVFHGALTWGYTTPGSIGYTGS